MKSVLFNLGYFLKEVKTTIGLNKVSNVFSLLSIGLIIFILSMVVSGWWISSQVLELIKEESEISVYVNEESNLKVVEDIRNIEGVKAARIVGEDEAYDRMAEILGKEAQVLEYFEENPFGSYIEVKLHLEKMDDIIEKLYPIQGIDHIRDNREVLNRIREISRMAGLLGYAIIGAVSISTLVIISHIIRQGIYDNREEIKTLRLLGAPEAFIIFPFVLQGLLLTLGGGIIANILSVFSIKYIYAQISGPLPFLPLPDMQNIVSVTGVLIIALSIILGLVGSFFGLSSSKSS